MNRISSLARSLSLTALILCAGISGKQPARAQGSGTAEGGAKFFREQVHPILEAKCYKCHGGEKIKADLVLTNREGLIEGGENGSALDTANPEKSLLLEMITYRDSSHEMPPSGKLPAEQIDILNRWIMQGAPYDAALEKKTAHKKDRANPGNSAPWWAYQPVREAESRPKPDLHPVDELLDKPLKSAGLRQNPSASRETLIRRAYYDLIGLPPSPEEVRNFANNKAPDAWPRLIDSLLARTEYGEKWARHWMDVVRYAESEGFERDSDKPHIWRYRDYLIEAFNSDLPYDQFVTEQIAGDELDPPSKRSLTATGFLRLMQFDDEPADRLQAKYDILADIVQVTGEAFLGMSIGCARCHDHKKDPISQKDYYSFMAFFHGMNDYGPSRSRPHLWLPDEERRALQEKQTRTLSGIQDEIVELEREARSWIQQHQPDTHLESFARILFDSTKPDAASLHYTQAQPPAHWKAENFNSEGWKTDKPLQNDAPVWLRARFGLTQVPKDAWLEVEFASETEIHFNGTSLLDAVNLPPGRHVFELNKRSKPHIGANTLAIRTTARDGVPRVRIIEGKPPLEAAADILRKAEKKHAGKPESKAAVDLANAIKSKAETWLAEATKIHGTPISAASESTTRPAPISIHRRGNPNAPGEQVEPAFPAALILNKQNPQAVITPVGTRSSGRRLALARWMTDPANPLLSRVAVNRIWQHHFGRGLVPSSNDFGRLGEPPTNPELLDMLASTFIKSGWSMKSMHKLVMTSAAYQQSSVNSAEGTARDPENKLLWRYPMRRLTAEELRDSVLSVSGILQLKPFGPPVYPPLPQAVLETQSRPGAGWPKQTSLESARRSVYVHVKRSLSVPLLADHDQAATDTPCAMRFTSTVPTQALGMLNSDFMNEHAQFFASRLLKEAGSDREKQIIRGLQLALQREPKPSEVKLCRDTIERLERDFQLPAEKALQRFALMALNLNEFVYLD